MAGSGDCATGSTGAGLSEGIHTRLGEQGNNLSVGQKQLLALARVLVETPQVLILMKPRPVLIPVLNRPFSTRWRRYVNTPRWW